MVFMFHDEIYRCADKTHVLAAIPTECTFFPFPILLTALYLNRFNVWRIFINEFDRQSTDSKHMFQLFTFWYVLDFLVAVGISLAQCSVFA